VGRGEAVESEALAQCREGAGVLGGSQVEVAAEKQRRIAGPLRRRFRGRQHVGCREVRPVVGRVQVGDAEVSTVPKRDTREGHRPPLRSSRVNRQLPPLDDPAVPVRLLLVRGA
jgi:hypothetical protein